MARTDRFAVASFVCSVAGFVTGVTAILGIVFGLVARSRIVRSEGSTKGMRLARAGVALGAVGLIWAGGVALVAIRASDDAALNLANSELPPSSAYPHGWKGQGPGLENDYASYFDNYATADDVRALASCLHISPANVDTNPAEAAGQEYDSPDGAVSVTMTIDVFSSPAAAAVDAIASGKADAKACAFQVWGNGGLRYAGFLQSAPAVVRRIPALGSHDSDIEVPEPDTHPGEHDIFYDDFVTIQQGPSEANLEVGTINSPPPANLIDQLARIAARHLQEN